MYCTIPVSKVVVYIMHIVHAVKSLRGPGVTSLRITSRLKTIHACSWRLSSSESVPGWISVVASSFAPSRALGRGAAWASQQLSPSAPPKVRSQMLCYGGCPEVWCVIERRQAGSTCFRIVFSWRGYAEKRCLIGQNSMKVKASPGRAYIWNLVWYRGYLFELIFLL